MIFFSISNLNPGIVIIKAPKHLLNATEVTTCRKAVEAYHVKMLNGVISYSQDSVSQRKTLFYLKVLLGNNFAQFDKWPGKYTSETRQVEIKPVCK